VTSADEFEMVVPFTVLVDIVGAERQPDGVYAFLAVATPPKPLTLRLGEHDLGQWVCDGAEIRAGHGEPSEAHVTMRRVSD
jgi:hypothetical protein